MRYRIVMVLVVFVAAMVGYFFVWPLFDEFVILPVRADVRANESLPKVSVQPNKMVYCRMQYRDFYFPLPDDARIAQPFQFHGGPDYVEGTVYVTNAVGAPIDLDAYETLLQRHHFNIFPQWFAAGGGDGEGGSVTVDIISNATQIAFHYDGDD